MVRAVPDLPPAPGGPARRPAPPPRRRPVLRPLPARRPDGGGGRLPGRATRCRAGAAPAGRIGSPGHGPVVHPDGRVPGVGRDHDPQPPAGSGPRRGVRGRHGGRLPARHVRPRGPDAPAVAPVRLRACRGLAWRPRAHEHLRLLVGVARRDRGAGPVPARRLQQRRHPPGRRQGARRPHGAVRADLRDAGGGPPGRSPAVDERHRPPDAAALARSGGGRGQRHPGRLRHRGGIAGRLPGGGHHRGTRPGGGRAAFRRSGQPADGGGVEPGRHPPGQRRRRAGPGTAGRTAQRPVAWPRPVAPRPAGRGLAGRHPQLGPRLGLRLLGGRGVRRRDPPLRRSPPDRGRADHPGAGRAGPSSGWRPDLGGEPLGPAPQRPGRDGRARHRGRRRNPGAGQLPRGTFARWPHPIAAGRRADRPALQRQRHRRCPVGAG